MSVPVEGLLERLKNKKDIVVAEGYVFEFERRGYLRAGCFVPEVVLNHPELVRSLHEEFVHAGSEVVLAFTYYGHRAKLKLIGRDDQVKELNLKALQLAKEVAVKTGTLMAGNICNTTVYECGNDEAVEAAKEMFKEQIQWAVECGADFIVAETFSDYGEAELALQCIKEYGNGLPAVVSFIAHGKEETFDGLTFPDACRKLEEAGADVVGLNCGRGPKTMMPLIREIRKVCKGPICMLPVPYRTIPEQPTMQSLKEAETDKQAFPFDLPAFACSRTEIAEFAREAKKVGVQYIGICCGNASHYLRVVAEEYGRKPPASKFSPDMSQHFIFGNKKHVKDYHATNYLPNM